MAVNFHLAVIMTAVDRLSRPLNRSQQQLMGMGRTLDNLGKKMIGGITLPTAFLGTAVAQTALEYERSMNRVQALTSKTAEEMQPLRAATMQIGEEFGVLPTQAAEALKFLSQAGIRSTQSLQGALEPALLLARATATELGPATDQLTDIVKAFGREVDASMIDTVDVLVGAVGDATQTFDDLASAMRLAAPAAAPMGVRFEETAAALSMLADRGLKATIGGTSLSSLFREMLQQQPKLVNAFKKLGITKAEVFDEEEKFRGLRQLLEALEGGIDRGGKLTDVLKVMEARGSRALSNLMSAGGSKALRDFEEGISRSGRAAQVAQVMMGGFPGVMERFKSAWQKAALTISQAGFIEALEVALETGTKWFAAITHANPGLIKFGLVVAGIAAALGPLLIVGKVLVGVFAALFSPIGLWIGAIVAFVAAINWLSKRFEFFQVIVDGVRATFQALVSWVGSTLGWFFRQASEFMGFTMPDLSRDYEREAGFIGPRSPLALAEMAHAGPGGTLRVRFENAPKTLEVMEEELRAVDVDVGWSMEEAWRGRAGSRWF